MGRKRTSLNIKDFLHKKRSIVTIRNKDILCLARALVVAIAKIEKDPSYGRLISAQETYQEKKARELHKLANVPLGHCSIPEVQLFQEYLTRYEINIVSANHNNSIIHPVKPSFKDPDVKPIYLYFHHNHYDVITTMSGFLGKSYFCHKCRRAYDQTLGHLCPDVCKLCRSPNCKDQEDPRKCDECNRMFKSKSCYEYHKKPIGKGKSVCEGIKKCKRCGKSLYVRHLDPKKHMWTPTGDPRPICFRCWKAEHIARDCRSANTRVVIQNTPVSNQNNPSN